MSACFETYPYSFAETSNEMYNASRLFDVCAFKQSVLDNHTAMTLAAGYQLAKTAYVGRAKKVILISQSN